MSQTETPPEAEAEAEEPEVPTLSIANKHGATTSHRDGTVYEFEKDSAQDVPEDLARELLTIKDAGFYEPGKEDVVQYIDPGLADAERRGRTMTSPYEPTPDVQEMLAQQEAAKQVMVGGTLYNVSELEIPPRHGRGSSAAAWQEYATSLGVSIPEDVTNRDQLIALLDSAGVPTEQPGGTTGTATISDDTDGDLEEGGGTVTPTVSATTSEVDPTGTTSEVDPEAQG